MVGAYACKKAPTCSYQFSIHSGSHDRVCASEDDADEQTNDSPALIIIKMGKVTSHNELIFLSCARRRGSSTELRIP